MTDQPDSREVEVTQADRDLAASILDNYGQPITAINARNGHMDDLPTVQSIARHRTAALATTADRVAVLEAELSAAVGYMENARIDLQTGCTKAVAIRTIEGGIKRARTALAPVPTA